MSIEKQLQNREKTADDQIICNESFVKTDDFTGLIENLIISNRQATALSLLKFQFAGMDLNKIVEKVKEHVQIGDDYHIVNSNPFITIYYDHQTRQGSN